MSILKSSFVVAFCTLLSRITGLLREIVIAQIFGTTQTADIVNVALKLPNLFRRIFGEGALSSVFIPLYTYKRSISKENAEVFSSNIISWLILVLCVLILLMIILMKPLMLIIAPGFVTHESSFKTAIFLCQITIPYLLFISIASLFGGILNSERKFFAFAFVPCLLNIVIVIFTLIGKNYMSSDLAISISVILGGIVQVIFMLIFVKKEKINISIIKPKLNSEVLDFLSKMLPATMSAGVTQINLFISQSIASFATGAIAILSYADRIYQLPLSIIGTTLSTILLPELSKLNIIDHDQSHKVKISALKFTILLSFPSSIGIIILAKPIIEIIYQRGAFTFEDTVNTAHTIMIFGLGLPAFIFNKIYTSIFYAHQNIKVLMKITVYSLVVNVCLNLALVWHLSFIGIATGAILSAWYNIIMLHRYAIQHEYLKFPKEVLFFALKVLVAAIIMGCLVKVSYFLLERKFGMILSTFSSISFGILAYFGMIILSKTARIQNRKVLL